MRVVEADGSRTIGSGAVWYDGRQANTRARTRRQGRDRATRWQPGLEDRRRAQRKDGIGICPSAKRSWPHSRPRRGSSPTSRRPTRRSEWPKTCCGKLALPNPRCRIDEASALMPDGHAVPLRVFTPLDIDFSLASGLKVTEDFARHHPVLPWRRVGERRPWTSTPDACTAMALRLERRVVAGGLPPRTRTPVPPGAARTATRWPASCTPATLLDRRGRRPCRALRRQRGRQPGRRGVAHGARPRRVPAPRTQMLLYPATYNDHDPVDLAASTPCGRTARTTCSPARDIRRLHGAVRLGARRPASNPYFAPLLAARPLAASPARSWSRPSTARCATRARRTRPRLALTTAATCSATVCSTPCTGTCCTPRCSTS